MNRARYTAICMEIRSEIGQVSYGEAFDLAQQLIEDDTDMREYLQRICADPVERLASDLS